MILYKTENNHTLFSDFLKYLSIDFFGLYDIIINNMGYKNTYVSCLEWRENDQNSENNGYNVFLPDRTAYG